MTPKPPKSSSAPRRPPAGPSSPRDPRPPRRRWLWLLVLMVLLSLIGTLMLGAHAIQLDRQIQAQFEGKRWALPARVFARPLELYVGLPLDADTLVQELTLLHYREGDREGEYQRQGHHLILRTRGFPFADGHEPPRQVRVSFSGGQISALETLDTGESVSLLRLEPALIANIYPSHGEDRVLVRLEDVPPALIQALLVVEDRKFYQHFGIDPMGITRAALANLRAGRTVQGGSTLTQQLVKNYFLTQDRTLARKFDEAIMALLLERRYDKDEILEAYLNEVYLGQDGARAIHGFGLASQFYFQRRLNELDLSEMALLVGIIRGPNFYEPRRRAERAIQRRNLVLSLMAQAGHLSAEDLAQAQAQPLNVSAQAPSGVSPFPAYVQLVREQLRRDYRDEDLREEGLLIFTTLDPMAQLAAERALTQELDRLERERRLTGNSLQGAVVVTSADNGEVLALVGDRQMRQAAFNRALQARRPVGSVIKPMVYLAALSQPQDFTLATLLDDDPLTVTLAHGDTWSPRNANRQHHGWVTVQESLVHSYNVSTVRLGLDLGLPVVVDQLQALGLERRVPPFPSLVLGAVEMTPLEVTRLYQGLASGGYQVPLRAIREVMDREGQLLQRYPLSLRRVADPDGVYLVTATLHEVTRSGTGRALQGRLPETLPVAGKTGTTDELRDAWFAGYSGDVLTVVWVGRDDNQPTGLSGASGALPVWAEVMSRVARRGLSQVPPENIEWHLVDPALGLPALEHCDTARWMPFIRGSVPQEFSPCGMTLD
ncbi:penicillin-binding protein 1B [Ectothiorhodospira magna]|uniref:Penicillin-binding protein 1B n=1 Tax=Ectothiorhodospira magna TaxID=867345 RepID=A0A1H8Z479_9GAMM|nr:penicillin-binding protein 1B [Ectothiorhodospira magna]SEP58408.1 penicillin-binding protein 1B [Ectothiorhodospira magna]